MGVKCGGTGTCGLTHSLLGEWWLARAVLTTAGLCFKTCSVKQPEPTEPESVLTVLDVQLVSVSCAQVCSSILLFFLVDTSLKERTTEMLCACSSSPCLAYGQVRACHYGVMFNC